MFSAGIETNPSNSSVREENKGMSPPIGTKDTQGGSFYMPSGIGGAHGGTGASPAFLKEEEEVVEEAKQAGEEAKEAVVALFATVGSKVGSTMVPTTSRPAHLTLPAPETSSPLRSRAAGNCIEGPSSHLAEGRRRSKSPPPSL